MPHPPPPPATPAPAGRPTGPDEARDLRLERVLSEEGLYPFPPDLAARILREVLGERAGQAAGLRPARALDLVLRAAAAVVLCLGAWTALLGRLPEGAWLAGPAAEGGPLARLPDAPAPLPAAAAWSAAPEIPAAWAPLLAAAALALLAAGLWLARRWGAGTDGPQGAEVRT